MKPFEEKIVAPLKAKLWERALILAQDGHAPSFYAMLAWGRIVTPKKDS